MANNLNPDSLEQIINKVKKKRMEDNYDPKDTRAEIIKALILADVYWEVCSHIGLSGYEAKHIRRINDLDSRRMAEIVDMVEGHWEGGICRPEHLLNEAINEAIERARKKGELQDDARHEGT